MRKSSQKRFESLFFHNLAGGVFQLPQMDNKKSIAGIVGGVVVVTAFSVIVSLKGLSAGGKKKGHREPFSIQAITSAIPSDPRWSTRCEIDLERILDQKFTYLTMGGQCYAFLSEDGRYVLKFLKQNNFSKKRFKNNAKILRKRTRDFTSYKIAFDHLREETGLLFIHLVARDGFRKQASFIDSFNIVHCIELGDFEFVLQKFADPILSTMNAAMQEDREEEAKKIIDAVFSFFYKRLNKGIVDRDPAIAGNLGSTDGVVVQIDIGRFLMATEPRQFKMELKEFLKKNQFFSTWLHNHYPDLEIYYKKQCSQLEKYYEARSIPKQPEKSGF